MNLTNCIPTAYAEIHGTASFPKLHGMAYFYDVTNGTVVVAEVEGLPDEDAQGAGSFFGFHIHEGSRCSGTPQDLLSATGGHYNPTLTMPEICLRFFPWQDLPGVPSIPDASAPTKSSAGRWLSTTRATIFRHSPRAIAAKR